MDFDQLLVYALDNKASDVHLVPGAKPSLRINGKLKNVEEADICQYEDILTFINKILPAYYKRKLEEVGEASFSYSQYEFGRFRVNVLKQRGTLSLSIRILRLNVPEVKELGLPDEFVKCIDQGSGLLVVSGPSGSGKSTTIASLVYEINKSQSLQVLTVESPIEYLFKHGNSVILQREVGVDCPTMLDGIISAFHHDPDVLVISNLRDEDAIESALQIAESGKLVIAGMNAVNTRTALEKLISGARPEHIASRKYKVSSTMLGIISQKLVPDITGENRIMSYELLLPNELIKQYIFEDRLDALPSALIAGRKKGLCYMDYSLFDLYKSGKITRETLLKFAHDLEYIRRLEIASGIQQ